MIFTFFNNWLWYFKTWFIGNKTLIMRLLNFNPTGWIWILANVFFQNLKVHLHLFSITFVSKQVVSLLEGTWPGRVQSLSLSIVNHVDTIGFVVWILQIKEPIIDFFLVWVPLSFQASSIRYRLLPVAFKLERLANLPLERSSFKCYNFILFSVHSNRIRIKSDVVVLIWPFVEQNRCIWRSDVLTLAHFG
jgi:hypothetical protein